MFNYRITGNFYSVKFLWFLTEKKTFNFCGFFFLQIENLDTKKNCLYYRKQQLKRCYGKQLVHITVVLRSKNIFSSLESFQRFQLLNTHLVNSKWQSVLVVEETGVPGENHWPATSQWQHLSHNVVSSSPRHELDSNSQL
jgi:hypothetical protein